MLFKTSSQEQRVSFLPSCRFGYGDRLPDEWERKHFGNLTKANATTDSDGDKLSDLVEFFLGSNPLASESGLLFRPVREPDAEEFRIVFPMRNDSTLRFVPEWSLDFSTWRSSGITIRNRTDLPSSEEWSFFEAVIEAPDVRQMFFRIDLRQE